MPPGDTGQCLGIFVASQLEGGAAGVQWVEAEMLLVSHMHGADPPQRVIQPNLAVRSPAWDLCTQRLSVLPALGREELQPRGISGDSSTGQERMLKSSVSVFASGGKTVVMGVGTHRTTAIVKGLVSGWSQLWEALTTTQAYDKRTFDITTINKKPGSLTVIRKRRQYESSENNPTLLHVGS